MEEEWIPFLEATERTCRRLFLTDFSAKPLLRAACGTKRIRSRGEYEEAGRIVISGTTDLSQDPTVMKVGGYYYVRETYPAEIGLASLHAWIVSMEKDALPPVLVPLRVENRTADGAENQSASYSAIDFAVAELGDKLKGLSVERSDELIQTFLRNNGRLVPSVRTLARYRADKRAKISQR
ncbi:hypothetical protein EJ074_20605 [Mesorhizobium sp. M3A.F.Ca.ET.080.04.2.1]|uniref:hypothetical protein n=1 Tax=Mesorhizobium sp. M3A.F.Ca.ET.080.04.2.1 TaxID=2493676 RepID=UPI000F75FAD7|nr:hypothetical protein [Mesorhizobium sp. M3A.F.Ca.ET.080.04.2.1]AZO11222.1 hypothetical protein EJ074_20605 [Mesorhizobium sp. M3A.F.Ca.ET.080.04.2.1]RWF24877.1 MAG: hypothetical protein EOS64_06320 [Mesorhizobium sp.]